jgi:hypothetical protein
MILLTIKLMMLYISGNAFIFQPLIVLLAAVSCVSCHIIGFLPVVLYMLLEKSSTGEDHFSCLTLYHPLAIMKKASYIKVYSAISSSLKKLFFKERFFFGYTKTFLSMPSKLSKQHISRIYLPLAPFLGAILAIAATQAFGMKHIDSKIYLPVWIIQSCLMVIAAWILGARNIRSNDAEKKHLAAIAMFMIVPWIFISIFAGFGPPPDSAVGWAATAAIQQIRYSILILAGVLITFGFALLREKLKNNGENFYSLLGFTAIMIATPLFIIDMTYWGSNLVESYKIFAASPSAKRPDWFLAVRPQYGIVSLVEVALTYLATAAFAASLKIARWFRPNNCRIYIILSAVGFIFDVLQSSCPEPFATAGFVVSIPAVPFIMPYLMGINLLRRTEN